MFLKYIFSATVVTVLSSLVFVPSVSATLLVVPPGSEEIPIDGGLGLLVAAGIAYGAKKAYDKRKKESGDQEEKTI